MEVEDGNEDAREMVIECVKCVCVWLVVVVDVVDVAGLVGKCSVQLFIQG